MKLPDLRLAFSILAASATFSASAEPLVNPKQVQLGAGVGAALAQPMNTSRGLSYGGNVITVADPQWGTALCGATPCPTGSGGDDYVPIQNAINAAAALGVAATVYFPPASSGYYNVCAGPLTRPSYASLYPTNALTFEGAGSGNGGVRILPSCGSPPTSVFYDPTPFNPTPSIRSLARTQFRNLRVDAYGLATYGIKIDYDPNLTMSNMVVRNSASGGANIYIGGGFGYNIDATNYLENVNDPGHVIYSTTTPPDYTKLPVYGMQLGTLGTAAVTSDSSICPTSVNVQFANFFNATGGDNILCGHGWGYQTTVGDGQAIGAPLYTFAGFGMFTATGVADSFVLAGVRDHILPSTSYVASAAKSANGTGGVNASGVYAVGGGTGTAATLNVTWSGGVMTVNSVASGGAYTVMPTSPAALTYVSGSATGWAGATASLTMTAGSIEAGTIVTAGSGGTANTRVTLTGTTGTGTKFTAYAYTNAAGALAVGQPVWIQTAGNYSVMPSNMANEPVTSTASLTGAALSLSPGQFTYGENGPIVAGVNIEGTISNTAYGVSMGANVIVPVIVGNNMTGLGGGSAYCVGSDTAIDSGAKIAGNGGCSEYYPPNYSYSFNGTQQLQIANNSTGASQLAQVSIQSNAGSVALQANGTGSGSFNQLAAFGNLPFYITSAGAAATLILKANGNTGISIGSTGAPTLPNLPTSSGGGGLYVCVDTSGNFYKKASCP